MPLTNKPAKDATWYFHHPDYKYNCAQAVAYVHEANSETITLLARRGAGRAPEGICGALYGGLTVLQDLPKEQQHLKESFLQKIGSLYCKEIRGKKLASCKTCVKVADEILKQMPIPVSSSAY